MSGDIVSLSEAKKFLNIPATATAADDELSSFISAASAMWARRIGPCASSAYTEWYDGGAPTIVLRKTPVLSVTTIVESYGSTVKYVLTEQPLDTATSMNAWGFTLDKDTGTVTRRASGVATSFSPGKRNIKVEYRAGYTETPADIRHAVLLLILHLWQTQRGGVANRVGEEWRPDMGFTWPARVEEIASNYLMPGIA